MNLKKDNECAIFGFAEDLNETILPTYGDVMRCYQQIRINAKTSKAEPKVADIINILTDKIVLIWEKASIQTLSRRRIVTMLTAYHTKFQNIKKNCCTSKKSCRF